jgi:tRNA 2-thiouridine synthesizing protein B
MATLHLVNAPSPRSAALAQCLYAAKAGDTVLLIENGTFCAVASTFDAIARKPAELTWCALADDVRSRGIESLLANTIVLVDDRAFVDLVIAHQPIVSWS